MNELIDPRRNLNLGSVQNLRDLGGYSTKEGRKTKWGIFLRSGDMSAMTKDDQAALLRQGDSMCHRFKDSEGDCDSPKRVF